MVAVATSYLDGNISSSSSPSSGFLVLSALSSVLFYGVCVVYVSVVFMYMCDVYRVCAVCV